MDIKTSIEPFSQAVIYYFKANELDMHLAFFKSVFSNMQPRFAQIGSSGTIVVPNNKIKIVFENMLPKQVETFLFDKQALSIAPVKKSHELILMFEDKHSHLALQWHEDSKANPDFYYKFDFLSASFAAGGIKGYLSVIVPDNCITTWENKLEKGNGTYLAYGKIPMGANLATELYHSHYNELQRDFSSSALYLIFQVTDLEFGRIEQKMFDIELSCIAGKFSYSAHSLFPNSYNCVSSLSLLTEVLGINGSAFEYFFDEQLDTKSLARKFALVSSRPINIAKYTDLFTASLNRVMKKDDDATSINYMENYVLVSCDEIREHKINNDTCNYNDICALIRETEVHDHLLAYNEENNYFSSHTSIFRIDAGHQIID